MPSVVSRWPSLVTLLPSFTRKASTALSMSPPVSSSEPLHSMRPAPVRRRSALMSWALIFTSVTWSPPRRPQRAQPASRQRAPRRRLRASWGRPSAWQQPWALRRPSAWPGPSRRAWRRQPGRPGQPRPRPQQRAPEGRRPGQQQRPQQRRAERSGACSPARTPELRRERQRPRRPEQQRPARQRRAGAGGAAFPGDPGLPGAPGGRPPGPGANLAGGRRAHRLLHRDGRQRFGGGHSGLFLSLAASFGFGFATGAFLGFTLRALFGLTLEARLFLLAPVRVALGHDVADRLDDQLAGLERVVVARDDDVDAIRVAVGVDEPDDRDPQALGLGNRDRFGVEVDHEDGVRETLQRGDATEVRAELGEVGFSGQTLTRRQQLQLAFLLVTLEVVQALDPQTDRLEVGEQTAEPAVLDERHAGGERVGLDRILGGLLGTDEEDLAAAVGDRRDELLGVEQRALGLQQVDDVDALGFTVDEAAHFRVPATGLVTHVNACLKQALEIDVAHSVGCPCVGPAYVPV